MPNFQVSITNPITNAPDTLIAAGVLTVQDHSNYLTSDEAGHLKAHFADFYKVLITLPNGDEVLYSSLGDGNYSVTLPSAGDPSVAYTYVTGDGQYFATIYTLPTYQAGVAYVYSTSNPVYVYSATKIYKNIQTGTGQTPASSPTYWTEITDIDLLPSKYRLVQRIIIDADSRRYYARKIYNANVLNQLVGNNWEKLLRDPEFIIAVMMFIDINAIPTLLDNSRFVEIDTTINHLKQLASTGEVL